MCSYFWGNLSCLGIMYFKSELKIDVKILNQKKVIVWHKFKICKRLDQDTTFILMIDCSNLKGLQLARLRTSEPNLATMVCN